MYLLRYVPKNEAKARGRIVGAGLMCALRPVSDVC